MVMAFKKKAKVEEVIELTPPEQVIPEVVLQSPLEEVTIIYPTMEKVLPSRPDDR